MSDRINMYWIYLRDLRMMRGTTSVQREPEPTMNRNTLKRILITLGFTAGLKRSTSTTRRFQ